MKALKVNSKIVDVTKKHKDERNGMLKTVKPRKSEKGTTRGTKRK